MVSNLSGKRILITRTNDRADQLVRLIKDNGGESVLFPLFETRPLKDKSELKKAIKILDECDFIVFVSPAAVKFGLAEIFSERAWPEHTVAASVGEGTASLLKQNGIDQIILPQEHFSSDGLLSHPALQENVVKGKKIMIMRAQYGRLLLAKTLLERGAKLILVTCYERVANRVDGLLSLIHNNSVDAVTAFSSESLYRMKGLTDTDVLKNHAEKLFDLPLFSPHERVANLAKQLGWRCIVESKCSDNELVKCLCEFDWH